MASVTLSFSGGSLRDSHFAYLFTFEKSHVVFPFVYLSILRNGLPHMAVFVYSSHGSNGKRQLLFPCSVLFNMCEHQELPPRRAPVAFIVAKDLLLVAAARWGRAQPLGCERLPPRKQLSFTDGSVGRINENPRL